MALPPQRVTTTINDAAEHFYTGVRLRDCGRIDEAIGAFTRAVELKPDFVEAWFKLGMTLRRARRLDEAVAAYRKVIALNPALADAHNNLANVLRDAGDVAGAIAEYNEAARLKPGDAVTQLNVGNACAEMQRLDDALVAYRRAVHLAPGDARMHEALGAALLLRHDMPGAIGCLRRAIDLSPQSAIAWNGIGLAMRSLGRFDEAAECFRRAAAIEPDNAVLRRNLTTVRRALAVEQAEIDRLRRLMHDAARAVDERIDAGFALGKVLDDAGRYDEAFAAYGDANALVKSSRAARGERFDAANLRRTIDRLIANFTPDFFAARRGWGDPSELPVFIVGMPRTGTTLVEQIAASHSAMFGAGELRDIENISTTLARGGDRTNGATWDEPSIAAAATSHLQRLRALGGKRALRVLDKMPGNILHLGLIAVLFPGARVILCRRDARDTCLSCYFQHFDSRAVHLYLYDLADCAAQYARTERLAAHWLKALPLRILEVQYESLVANQEPESRRLIDFLGLPWEPACLEFHRAPRSVYTASVWQVRQPMYASSVGRWRHYEKHLGPMLDVLAHPAIAT